MMKEKFTLKRGELLKSELFKEIAKIRTDTLWRMLSLKYLPSPNEEGATGRYDGHGAIILPGGFIYQDSERSKIKKEPFSHVPVSKTEFISRIREGLSDNAVLMYQDGMSSGVNLDNSHFVNLALDILETRKDARKNRKRIDSGYENKTKEDIARSYLPSSMSKDAIIGSRSTLTSSIGVSLSYPAVYKDLAKIDLRLDRDQKKELSDMIKESRKPIKGQRNTLLANPYEIILHDSRYSKYSITGLTRIIGDGEFGEFITFTLEEATNQMLKSMGRTKLSIDEKFAEYKGKSYVGIIRHYPPVSVPGKRTPDTKRYLIKPKIDLELNLKEVEESARDYYEIPMNKYF